MTKSELEKLVKEKTAEAEMWRLERNKLEQRMFEAWNERDALRAEVELLANNAKPIVDAAIRDRDYWMKKKTKPVKRTPKIEKGDRFQECDKRFFRVVEVVAVHKDCVEICTVRPNGIELMPRVTKASKDRFFRRSHGYSFMGRCHECQIKRGGVVPHGDHRNITVSMGACGGCLKQDATLVPSCDYHWPKKGQKAIWD